MRLTGQIKQSIRGVIPRSYREPLKRFVLSNLYFGFRFRCNVCRSSVRKWNPTGYDFPVIEKYRIVGGGLRQALCPVCGASDRVRLLLHFLRSSTDLFSKPAKLLHIAPEQPLEYLLKQLSLVDYLTADLNPEDVMMQVDITNPPFQGGSFDAIICNHVLEHIPDDKKAMHELFRILKPGGWAILQVPLSLVLDQTYEDFSITDERERERVFGQKDHVRIYGQDYIDRLKQSGFIVSEYRWTDDPALRTEGAKMSLNREETIFYCKK